MDIYIFYYYCKCKIDRFDVLYTFGEQNQFVKVNKKNINEIDLDSKLDKK